MTSLLVREWLIFVLGMGSVSNLYSVIEFIFGLINVSIANSFSSLYYANSIFHCSTIWDRSKETSNANNQLLNISSKSSNGSKSDVLELIFVWIQTAFDIERLRKLGNGFPTKYFVPDSIWKCFTFVYQKFLIPTCFLTII